MQVAANPSRTLVKICGVRSPEEAGRILDLGADAIGVVVAEGSPRRVSPADALAIAGVAPARTVLVGRGSEPGWAELARSWSGPAQIHGPNPLQGRRFIRAIHAESPLPEGSPEFAACLLDAPVAGSGQAWDWSRARSPWPACPLILAGGLTPGNVGSAISGAQPWAVDVSSGVERERGHKDLELVAAFLHAVRACDSTAGRSGEPTPRGFESLR